MKKLLAMTAAVSLAAMTASAGTSVNIDFASAYVFRGVTVFDDLVIQPSAEIDGFGMPEEYGTIALGIWGSSAPYSDSYDKLHETDWYLSYTLPELVSNLVLSVGLTEYQYNFPGGQTELNFGAGYALGDFMLGSTINFITDDATPGGGAEKQTYIDFFADYAIEVSEDLNVNVGGLIGLIFQGDNVPLRDDGFNQYELYGDLIYSINEMWSIGGSLMYIGQIDDSVLLDIDYDKGLVAMFSVGCDM
jgi:uncharacterized protein (TIGR02001 family)